MRRARLWGGAQAAPPQGRARGVLGDCSDGHRQVLGFPGFGSHWGVSHSRRSGAPARDAGPRRVATPAAGATGKRRGGVRGSTRRHNWPLACTAARRLSWGLARNNGGDIASLAHKEYVQSWRHSAQAETKPSIRGGHHTSGRMVRKTGLVDTGRGETGAGRGGASGGACTAARWPGGRERAPIRDAAVGQAGGGAPRAVSKRGGFGAGRVASTAARAR